MRRELNVSDDELLIGAVGRIERQKRFDILIDAIQSLKLDRPFKVVIAGEGSLRPEIERLIQKQQLGDRCVTIGHYPDMPKLYQGFDLLVQSSDYEGTPTVVVEAMAMEIPVVATDAGGTGQLITHQQHGLVVPCGQPGKLAAAIREAAQDHAGTMARVRSAKRRVESELSFNTRINRLQQIYDELAALT